MSEKELRSAERTLANGTWAITFGALLFSVLTVTPLVMRVTPDRWHWTAPILPIVVDSAVVIVVRLDSIVSRLGGSGGAWPALLRWMTGIMTLALNVANSALHHDMVGVAVHSVAPLLLIVTAEAALAYRRAITRALDRIAQEEAAAAEQARREREAAENRAREERERAQAAADAKEREELERAERKEREREEREERRLREERDHALRLEREHAEREEKRLREQREHALRLEQERTARDAAERQAQAEREERERQEAAAAVAAARQQQELARAAVPAQAAPVKRRATAVVRDVSVNEFAGMEADAAEAALYAIYRQARDESTFANWQDDPRFRQGGDLNGSQLGVRLGRSPAAGRTNVKPKFEAWYEQELAERAAGGAERELASA
jgi:hypothetical protein